MADFVFYDAYKADVHNGVHDLASDDLYCALSNTAPTVATDDELADVTQIAAGNGYSAGGTQLTSVTSTQTSGTYTLGADDVVFTASGGDIATSRYQIIYNGSATNDELIGYIDRGSSSTITSGNTRTVDFPAGVVFTLATDT